MILKKIEDNEIKVDDEYIFDKTIKELIISRVDYFLKN